MPWASYFGKVYLRETSLVNPVKWAPGYGLIQFIVKVCHVRAYLLFINYLFFSFQDQITALRKYGHCLGPVIACCKMQAV